MKRTELHMITLVAECVPQPLDYMMLQKRIAVTTETALRETEEDHDNADINF